ncbi:hypothetical protein DICPUDRAFT_91919 [Dictyostelium purpureum]|uniref:PA14 domain-containing protein n=1 Tax=Dictyostelium purpureum TaxID=5786 RepID=F0ZJ92_DICPU|nr:uncharacterized protein DICPUDRAFT_91919 [Dictyostelium purpureum]EGC35995.1 hypothetical protein DICPUDRAFT_91919 [Dictyostelium purpureum]|eukprot:XP_003287496.1 hypothetical protein DICPUDRAFT_91919 [Dictyostelium purpureum]
MRIYYLYLIFLISISFISVKSNDDISFVIYDTTPSREIDFNENIPDYRIQDIVTGKLGSDGLPQWNTNKYPNSVKDKNGNTIIQSKESFSEWFRPVQGKTFPIIKTMKYGKSKDPKFDCQYIINHPIDNQGFDNKIQYPSSGKAVANTTHNYYYTMHMKLNVQVLDGSEPIVDVSLYNDVMIYIDGNLAYQMFYSGEADGVSYNLLKYKPDAKVGDVFQVDVFTTQRKIPSPDYEFIISFSSLKIFCPFVDSAGVCLGDGSLTPCDNDPCKQMVDGVCYYSGNCISSEEPSSIGILTTTSVPNKPHYRCDQDSCPRGYNCIQLQKAYTCVSCWFYDHCSPDLLKLFN